MNNCKDFEKYIFLVNNTCISIESKDKMEAIKTFESEFKMLFNMDWNIKRLGTEITIDGEYNRY